MSDKFEGTASWKPFKLQSSVDASIEALKKKLNGFQAGEGVTYNAFDQEKEGGGTVKAVNTVSITMNTEDRKNTAVSHMRFRTR